MSINGFKNREDLELPYFTSYRLSTVYPAGELSRVFVPRGPPPSIVLVALAVRVNTEIDRKETSNKPRSIEHYDT